jgi:site-specific DNA-methyltransferase (adenine-specific)
LLPGFEEFGGEGFMIALTCEDCMDLMARYPDKYFDLAVADPPYGIGEEWKKNLYGNSKKYKGIPFPETTYKNNKIHPKEYFGELFRVSKEQVVFGYNYFVEFLGPTNYLIVWDKASYNDNISFYSKAEIAYTSIRIPLSIIRVQWDGVLMGKETGKRKIHPHQKPVELYEKILRKYAKPGWHVLDTHLGSGSSAIACHRLGLGMTACEIDPQYFKLAKKRVEAETMQQELFLPELRRFREGFLFEGLKEAQ